MKLVTPPLELLQLPGACGKAPIEALGELLILEAAVVSVQPAVGLDAVKDGVTGSAFLVGTAELDVNMCVYST